MGAPIPGATGDPLPAPAITENTWPAARRNHRLIYLGKDWVLDWTRSTGDFQVLRVERNPAAGADPLPGPIVCQKSWAGIRSDNELVYLGGDRVLDWKPGAKRFRVWLINRATAGNADPIAGVPQTEGPWPTIDGDHTLISLGGDRVLDWVSGTGDYRVWRVDPLAVGATDPLAEVVNQGRWNSIRGDRRLIPMGNDRVLDWKPATGDYRVWIYNRAVAGDPFPGDPEVVGQWSTIRAGHDLVYVEGDRVIDWEPANGHFLLYRYDRNVTTLRRGIVLLHLRVLSPPRHFTLDQMVAFAKSLYASYGIEILEKSRQDLNVDGTAQAYLNNLTIGECRRSVGPTSAQIELFEMRGVAGANEIVVYLVRDLQNDAHGCATHPPGKPGAVISAKRATEWTLAHEIGHVLGLDHTDFVDRERLMNLEGTFSATNPPPDITTDEMATILKSPLLIK